MSSGCRLGLGGWGGPAVTWPPGGPVWWAAVRDRGAGVRSSPSALGWAGVLQCVRLCGLASAGGNSLRGLHPGAGGVSPGVSGVYAGGVCGSLGGMGVSWGVGLLAVGVRGLPGVKVGEGCFADGSVAGVCGCLRGWGRPVLRGPGLRAIMGVCGSPGGKPGGGLRGGVCCVGVCVRLQLRVCVVCCRRGGLEEKLAVFCGRGKDFADEGAYLVHLLVSGGKRVC